MPEFMIAPSGAIRSMYFLKRLLAKVRAAALLGLSVASQLCLSEVACRMRTDDIEYRVGGVATTTEIPIDLFESSGIHRPTQEPRWIARMFSAPCLVVTARFDGHLVGICRSLTDYAYCCYVSGLAVDRDFQGRGIGASLRHLTHDAVGDEASMVLLSAPVAVGFHPRVWFGPADTAFLLRRKR